MTDEPAIEDTPVVSPAPARPTPVLIATRTARSWVLVALGVVALLAPLRLSAVPLRDVTTAVAMAVAVLGVNLMAGFVGRVALGHGAFVGAGAYTTVILSADHHWPMLATVPAAAAVGFAVGLVVGLPALRIRGLHLALVTLAVGASFGPIIKRLGTLTNGPNGKSSTAAWVAPTWLGESRDANGRWTYLAVMIVAVIVFVLVRNLTNGRVGRSLVALRDGEIAALTSGIAVRRYSVTMFGCSAGVAAIAGSLLMVQTPFAAISGYESSLSLYLYAAATVAGLASISGAVIGGIILVGVPYMTSKLGVGVDNSIIFGLGLIAAVTFFPAGISSVFSLRRGGRAAVYATGQ